MTRLYLVRHGQSTWNLERRLQGQIAHIPLTDLGRRQAAAVADRLATARVGSIFSSDQRRAADTARIIGARLGIEPVLTALLREQGRGRLEGLLPSELVAEPVPAGLDITNVRWGGGENVPDVRQRLGRFLDALRADRLRADARPSAPVVVVTHGDTLAILLAMLDGRADRDVDWNVVANGAIVCREWP